MAAPRYQVLPLPDHQAVFLAEGVEKLRWHFSPTSPRPFIYPFCGPAQVSLTRMGHPGAPNHDHHRSIWFGHHRVAGVDFWSETTPAIVRQREWLVYQDGPDEAVLGVRLDWLDGHNPAPLLTQTLLLGFRLDRDGNTLLELQSEFVPTAEQLELGQTNFGFLAIRVAKSISAYFGAGELTGSDGVTGEPALFGKPSRWMDYSGPIPVGTGADRREVVEGITCFDHPHNPGFPSSWHVREDGWMGASVCKNQPLLITQKQPLVLRYLLWGHAGGPEATRQAELATEFGNRSPWTLRRAMQKHHYWEVVRD